MGIFDSIMSAIFNHATGAQVGSAGASLGGQMPSSSGGSNPTGGSSAGTSNSLSMGANRPAGSAGGLGAAAGGAAPAAANAAHGVDVEAVLTERASHKKEHLNWRSSIVDLMKVLDLDASLGARKQLAQELGYTGEPNGSAEMNMWLHKQVMQKLAANGGKVPADLTS